MPAALKAASSAMTNCVVSLDNINLAAKRRASRSIPEDSSVTPKRSKGRQNLTKAKQPTKSPGQLLGN